MAKRDKTKRWNAKVYYLTPRYPQSHDFEEIEELQELIELGPSWYEIGHVAITLNNPNELEGRKAYHEEALALVRLQS